MLFAISFLLSSLFLHFAAIFRLLMLPCFRHFIIFFSPRHFSPFSYDAFFADLFLLRHFDYHAAICRLLLITIFIY